MKAIRLFVILCFGLLLVGTPVQAKEPVAAVPARSDGPATTGTVSGTIAKVDRYQSQIGFFSDHPFWGPPRYGAGAVVLWPTDTFFILYVAGPSPITIDGKKAGFADLKIGQRVSAQYNIALSGWGLSCVARRVDVHTLAPAKSDRAKATRKR